MVQKDIPGLPPRSEWIDLPPNERINIVGHRGYVGGNSSDTWF